MNAIAEVRFFPQTQVNQLETRFDAEFGVLWGFMNPKAQANIQPSVIGRVARLC